MQLLIERPGAATVALEFKAKDLVGNVKAAALRFEDDNISIADARLVYGGVHLRDEHRLGDYSLKDFATLQLHVPLRGGGGDGGATGAESRSCYLEMYLDKKPDKVDPAEARVAKWTRCRLSGELLSPPCAVDMLGNLYNKEAVVQHLVLKKVPPSLGHLKSLKVSSQKQKGYDCVSPKELRRRASLVFSGWL